MIASFNARLGAKQYGGDVAIRSPVLRRVASRIRTRLDRVQDGWPVHSAEVRDEGDQLRVEFLVPGYSIENLRLVVEDQVLHLIATRPGVEGGAQDRELHVIARLPRPVEANLVAAELEAGVLTVTAPTRSGFRVPIQPRPTTTPASDGPGAAR